MIGVANWVLGRILGTGGIEGERYGTGIVCWQQIVLGGLDRGWEWEREGERYVTAIVCWQQIVLGGLDRGWVGEREGERYVTGIVCWQQIVLGGLDRGWEGEREGERYVTGIVCWQQIVLGGLDRGWEGMGWEGWAGRKDGKVWTALEGRGREIIKQIMRYVLRC